MHRTHKANEKSEQTFGKSRERRKKLFKKSIDFLNSFCFYKGIGKKLWN